MERLTYWCDDGMGGGEYRVNENGAEYSGHFIDRLATYEDTGLEPQTISEILDSVSEWYDAHKEGRLLVLPCKVGETIYYLNPFDEIEKGRITMIQQKANGTLKFRVTTTFSHDVTSDAIGKSVFRTREEAEAKLKEREGT